MNEEQINKEQSKAEMEDIFVPKWTNAQKCPLCGQLGMCEWSESSTARMCQNCKHIEDRDYIEKKIK